MSRSTRIVAAVTGAVLTLALGSAAQAAPLVTSAKATASAVDDPGTPTLQTEPEPLVPGGTMAPPAPNSIELFAQQTMVEVAFACMKTEGQVASTARSSEYLPQLPEATAIPIAPTVSEMEPAPRCATGAIENVASLMASTPNEGIAKVRLMNMRDDAKVRNIDILSPTGTGGGGTNPPRTTRQPAMAPSLLAAASLTTGQKRAWTSQRGIHDSYATFWAKYGTPKDLVWGNEKCSVVGPGPYKMTRPCVRHDFSYRNLKNLKGFNKDNKARADTKFEVDMLVHCGSNYSGVHLKACQQQAAVYGAGVRSLAKPFTIRYIKTGSFVF